MTELKRGAMIPYFLREGSARSWQTQDWQHELKQLITKPVDLTPQLNLSAQQLEIMQLTSQNFPLRIPSGYLDRIPTKDINHPLLKQFIPSFVGMRSR